MQAMSPLVQKSLIEDTAKRRNELSAEIGALTRQRAGYLEKRVAEDGVLGTRSEERVARTEKQPYSLLATHPSVLFFGFSKNQRKQRHLDVEGASQLRTVAVMR